MSDAALHSKYPIGTVAGVIWTVVGVVVTVVGVVETATGVIVADAKTVVMGRRQPLSRSPPRPSPR